MPPTRLLNVHSLTFQDFWPGDWPRYAIASHRWHAGTEATFKEFARQRNLEKLGSQKVLRFAEYVKNNLPGLSWLWVDTACIDQRNSAEISEAVNSMFKWYSQAEVCLAYLEDVDVSDATGIARSEWFTRGWTLQEMLAPRTVLFLNSQWQIIGHKGMSLRDQLGVHEIGPSLAGAIASFTKIPENVLGDYRQSEGVSAEVKMAWMSGRKTTREEDLYYCLLGILNLTMPIIYGEGADGAQRRLLREISEVPRASRSIDRVIESLSFPSIEDRKNHIHTAYSGTYTWALESAEANNAGLNNFLVWLQDPQPKNRIFWISAKPGAGKSSLIHFIDEELRQEDHMQPWAGGDQILRATYFFWSPGIHLQKTLEGFLRTILHQLFKAMPGLVHSSVPSYSQQAGNSFKESAKSWTIPELKQCLKKFLDSIPPGMKVFCLVDGLDELDGNDDDRDSLIGLLKDLARYAYVKLCISSRRWTVFQDAFNEGPHLKLEDYNRQDIKIYVRGQLRSQARYQRMLAFEPESQALEDIVLARAQGVFLWVRLVVKDLVRGIRDGDTFPMLQSKLVSIPDDLGDYFARLLDSIDPDHRQEACTILQIALYEEKNFVALHTLTLLDLIFIQDAALDFSLSEQRSEAYIRDFCDGQVLAYKMESLLRRLSSHCKGLLECFFHPGSTIADLMEGQDEGLRCQNVARRWASEHWTELDPAHPIVTSLPDTLGPMLHHHRYLAFDFRVDFMHRSLRDYLLGPACQTFLQRHTKGPFDARNYLRNTRLMGIYMCAHVRLQPEMAVSLASFVISTLSVPSFRGHTLCSDFCARLRPVIDFVRHGVDGQAASPWYIAESLEMWDLEKSNFLTLAVDFALTSYLGQNLTAAAIRTKVGRPFLDHALRPRFRGMSSHMSVGNQFPIPELVEKMIVMGANPNETYEDGHVWALFLLSIVNDGPLGADPPASVAAYQRTLEVMIRGGATTAIPKLALFTSEGYCVDEVDFSYDGLPLDVHSRREGFYILKSIAASSAGTEIPLLQILDCFRPQLGDGIDHIKALVEHRSKAAFRLNV